MAPLVHVGRRRAPRDEQADVAQVYLLPEDSPLGRYNVHVLVSSNPRIYVGAALPQLLGKQAMRAVIAHELGHCFDTGQAAADIALIAWRALALPALLAGATRLVYGASPAAIGPSCTPESCAMFEGLLHSERDRNEER